jgi:glycosyltransferase involved in cell wall biosynthesis
MSAPLRILALNWRDIRHPQAGGAEINLFEQARRWVRDGHEVTIICADPGPKYASQQEESIDGVVIRRMGNRFTVYILALIFYLMYVRSFDYIVDVSNGIPFFAPLIARIPGALIVHHYHGKQWFSEFSFPVAAFGWFLESTIVPIIYSHWPVITVSPTTRDAMINLGFHPSQIRVIYNGIKMPGKKPVQPGLSRPQIAYVGRMKRYKRIDRLVKIVSDLRAQFPDIHLDLAGEGDARSDIEALIDRLDMKDYVTMHGYVDEDTKAAILSSATVFATPSMHEGWGLSVIEANAYGCPAVAYDVPGLCVAIRHGETGLLAKNDDQFRTALAHIISDPVTRNCLSEGAYAWASRFTWDTCARETLEVLQTWKTFNPAIQNA